MISKLRKSIFPLQKILAIPFIALKINPNLVSLLGLLFAIIGAFFVLQQDWLLALIFFILAPTMDLIDGTVAKVLNKTSNWGNYFETMIDKFVDFVILGSFVFVPGLGFASILALGFSMISSYAKPRVALVIITDNHDWPAIGEHADKLVIILLALFLSVVGFTQLNLINFSINTIEFALYLIALISAIGSLQRMFYAKKLILEAEKKGNLLPYIKKKSLR